MAVLSAVRAPSLDLEDFESPEIAQKLRNRAHDILGTKHDEQAPLHGDTKAPGGVTNDDVKGFRSATDEHGVGSKTDRTRDGPQRQESRTRRHSPGTTKSTRSGYDSYRPRHAKKMSYRNTQRSELVQAQKPPITAQNLTEYLRIVDAAAIKFKNGDGKVNPSHYGSTLEYDLGLCYATFFTLQVCEHGVHCAWRHHPLTVEEKRWIANALDHYNTVLFLDRTAQQKTVAEPTFGLAAWLLRAGRIRPATLQG